MGTRPRDSNLTGAPRAGPQGGREGLRIWPSGTSDDEEIIRTLIDSFGGQQLCIVTAGRGTAPIGVPDCIPRSCFYPAITTRSD